MKSDAVITNIFNLLCKTAGKDGRLKEKSNQDYKFTSICF